jgi:hypothetical protein
MAAALCDSMVGGRTEQMMPNEIFAAWLNNTQKECMTTVKMPPDRRAKYEGWSRVQHFASFSPTTNTATREHLRERAL